MATFCIPDAPGVPGLYGQPPYWLPAGLYPLRTELDDPRWHGAYRRNFNGDVAFRAIQDANGSPKSLYLSWNALFLPNLDDADDRLYVGFRPNGGTTALVLKILVHAGGSVAAGDAKNVGAIDAFTNTGPGGSWVTVATPTWVNQNTNAWVELLGGDTGSFAVQMRVPISTSGGVTNGAGPQLGNDPSVWWFVTGSDVDGNFIELAKSPNLGTIGDLFDSTFPDPGGWDRLSTIAGDPQCPTTGGVALMSTDIGTMNTPNSLIGYNLANPSAGPNNVFFARPRNYTGATIPVGGIKARFRIAKWGSVADPDTDWVTIPGGGGLDGTGVASTASIPAIPSGSAPPSTNPITFNWQLNGADIAAFITGATPHKCMLVEMDGPGLTFFNESVYRNMDFGSASTFKREAEISIAGLKGVEGDGPRRDVYLAIETRNMPAVVKPGEGPGHDVELPWDSGQGDGDQNPKPKQAQQQVPVPHKVTWKQAHAMAVGGGLSEDVIETFMPTYRVHVYYDTGRRYDGRVILRPQTYFGYFINHEGDLYGWRQELHASPDAELKVIREGYYYRVSIPKDKSVQVTTVIEARESGGGGPETGPGDAPGTPPKGCLAALFDLFK